MPKDILSLISNNMGGFSKGQKLIANYILSSYDKAAFMTASRLGKTVHVSESTVVRFASELGYDGYPSMQRALQEMIRNKLTSLQRIEVTNDRLGNHDVLTAVFQTDIEKLRMTAEEIDRAAFGRAVDTIVGAQRIYIMGSRSSTPLASFLFFYFNLIFEDVVLINSNSLSGALEQMLRIGQRDVLVGISFPRYSRETVRAMQFAADRGASTIAVTDSVDSPLASRAGVTLLAKSDMVSFLDSLVAPLSVLNALIVSVSRHMNDDISRTFSTLERIWDEYEVYERSDGE
ncbi:MAG TPA: MurR/RpiR family transcriptional regulator [Oscillospiraceae bacterium]|nr:MurR/RpiR family transcriptional regulator [Oscillospiraceae bacterium]